MLDNQNFPSTKKMMGKYLTIRNYIHMLHLNLRYQILFFPLLIKEHKANDNIQNPHDIFVK